MVIPARARMGIALLTAALAVSFATASARAATYKLPPTGQNQWYWEIDPPSAGLASLPATTGAYPAPGSANIWDTDLFQDSNTSGIPTGPSPVVQALHTSGKYSICYVEVGAYQQGFPDDSNFAASDYGNGAQQYAMQGWPGEYWFDISGFANYVPGDSSTLTGAAVNIAAALDKRIGWCSLEGQDALEPDDLDGYTNPGATGVAGGGWNLTQADSAGFERWLAYDAHAHGLAIFQKNDPANASANVSAFDGMIIEECNKYNDPCAGSGGDGTPYLNAGKPVLNAEYAQDGESTSKFCTADTTAGITGALFDVNLDGSTYQPCAPVGTTSTGGTGGTGGSTGGTGGSTGGTGGSTGGTGGSTGGTGGSTGGTGGSTGGTGGSTGGTGGTGGSTGGTGGSTGSTGGSTGGTGGTTGGTGGSTGGTGGITGGSGSGSTGSKPVNTTAPSLSGSAAEGSRLKVSHGVWSGSPTSYTYAWDRCKGAVCTTIANATGQTYRVRVADIGYRLVAVVTATNTTGSASAKSQPSGVVPAPSARITAMRRTTLTHRHTAKHRRVEHHRRAQAHVRPRHSLWPAQRR